MIIDVYSDEIYVNDRYIGIGSLFVPHTKKDRLYKKLSSIRCLNEKSDQWVWDFDECDNLCRKVHHVNNNCEIHHKELSKHSSYARKEISKKWIDLLLNNNLQDQEMIYFQILYIDLKMLDKSRFGEENLLSNIYNRAYRMAIKGALKYFFDNQVEIENIYHDKEDGKEQHDYFPWHVAYMLKHEKNRVEMKTKEVTFLDSDHKQYLKSNKDLVIEAQFIQFIDLILGTVSQTLFGLSDDVEKIKLSIAVYPLVKRLINTHRNFNSSFHYYRKQSISVFPKNKPESMRDLFDNFSQIPAEFHRNIILKEPKIVDEKYSLDNWFNK